jgi:hypothetical protein
MKREESQATELRYPSFLRYKVRLTLPYGCHEPVDWGGTERHKGGDGGTQLPWFGAAGCEGSSPLAKSFAHPVCVSSIPNSSTNFLP